MQNDVFETFPGNADCTLREGDVHLWTQDLGRQPAAIARAKKLLSTAEKARADQFIHQRDHDRYVVAHGLMRSVLARYTGVAADKLSFRIDRFGKPHLDLECAPRLNFNLSHSGNTMLLGIVLDSRIGVDIEEVRPETATLEVAARFFNRQEIEELTRLPRTEQVHAFFRCWTRKEAYLKAIGCGLSVDPRECEVTLKPGEGAEIRRAVPGEGQGSGWSLYHPEGPAGYIRALAVDRPAARFYEKSV